MLGVKVFVGVSVGIAVEVSVGVLVEGSLGVEMLGGVAVSVNVSLGGPVYVAVASRGVAEVVYVADDVFV